MSTDRGENIDVDPRTGLVALDPDECLRLLRTSTLGRLAIVIEERPLVFPVNFTLDGHAVVLRTDEGTKLRAAVTGSSRSNATTSTVATTPDGVSSSAARQKRYANPSRSLGWNAFRSARGRRAGNRYGCASDPRRSPAVASPFPDYTEATRTPDRDSDSPIDADRPIRQQQSPPGEHDYLQVQRL